MIGNIPDKVVFINRKPQQIDWEWDDFKRENVKVGPTVVPLFVADPLKPKTVETGLSWAKDRWWSGKDTTTEHIPTQLEVENNPIQIKIISLETRSQGGRAYKVMFGENNYYVDLREDVLLDCILECKIEQGVPDCEFVWGKVGSQMKLVRVGSELHEQLIQTTEDGKKAKIKKSDLEVGGVYRNKKGEYQIYLGEFWVFDYQVKPNQDYYYGNGNPRETISDMGFVARQVWYEVSKWKSNRSDSFNIKDVEWDTYYSLKMVKMVNVIEKVAQYDIPSDWKEKMLEACKESFDHNYSNERAGRMSLSEITNTKLYYAKHIHFIPLTDVPKLNEDEFMKVIRDAHPNIGIIKEKK